MRSSLKKAAEDQCELEMTSMIDVVFLLLIFFLCTLKFKTLEGKLAAYLPKDVGVNTSEAEEIEKVEIVVKVVSPGEKLDAYGKGPWDPSRDANGNQKRFSYGPGRRLSYAVGPRKMTDVSELQTRLAQIYKADSERPATIDSRPGTVYEDVVAVLDATLNAGFTQITFVGSYED
ncbi:MAG: biopolymer transporter ExbD [Planctomycetes bacterium]|nr:biopolymer transporter ExbD [Planctomycetota bacterium]